VTKSTEHPLEWLPTGRTVAMRAAGEWWDAVRVPRYLGESVLTALGPACGAVIEDPSGALLYWLVPPGEAEGWQIQPGSGVYVQGAATHLAVPGPQRTAGPHWRVPPTRTRCLTDPVSLRRALAALDVGAIQ
jgi:hypothetical protein